MTATKHEYSPLSSDKSSISEETMPKSDTDHNNKATRARFASQQTRLQSWHWGLQYLKNMIDLKKKKKKKKDRRCFNLFPPLCQFLKKKKIKNEISFLVHGDKHRRRRRKPSGFEGAPDD